MELTFARAPLTVRVTRHGCNRTYTDLMRTRSQGAARMFRKGAVLFSLAVVSVALAMTASAQELLVRRNGVYLYSPRPADRSKIERAIDNAVSEMGMLKRSVARSRLRQSTEPIPRFQVHFEPERVLVRLYQHGGQRLSRPARHAFGLHSPHDDSPTAWFRAHRFLARRCVRSARHHYDHQGRGIVHVAHRLPRARWVLLDEGPQCVEQDATRQDQWQAQDALLSGRLSG